MTMDSRGVEPAHPARAPLAERIARGAAWVVGGRFFVRSIGLINTLVLARLLVPADFGLVAIAVTVMQLLQNISDIGVSGTVIKFREAGRAQYDTLFTLSVIRGALVASLLALASLFAGGFYEDPRIAIVFLGVSAVPVLNALVNPKFFEFERELDFSKQFWLSAIDKIAGVVVSIAVALAFRSYWAIVLGLVSGTFVQTALSWAMRPYRPRLSFSALREIGGFTGWLTGVSFMAALNNKLDVLVLGKLVSPGDVGAFFVGSSIAYLPNAEIAHPMARAIYPGLSELQDDPASMRETYLQGAVALAFIAAPASFGVAFVAHDLVALLLGDQWPRAVIMLQWISPAAGVLVMFHATNAYAMAQGKARLVFIRETITFLIAMPVFIAGAALYGLLGAAIAEAASLILIAGLNAGLYARLSGRSAFEPFWRARRPFAGIALMSAYFLLLRPHLGVLDDWPLFARLFADAAVGAGLYFAAVFALWRAEGAPSGIEKLALERARTAVAKFSS